LEKKSEDMHIRMEPNLHDFICDVADQVELPPSTAARVMLRDWQRFGSRGATEVIQQLRRNGEMPTDNE
jgi:hypothetical protein